MLKVTEIFRSIQGEGVGMGYEVAFVRFSGCNQKCAWCDTEYSWETGQFMTVEEVFQAVMNLGRYIPWVVFTGGEPLLQSEDDLQALTQRLQHEGIKVAIETNGTLTSKVDFQHVTVSPKMSSSGKRYASSGVLHRLDSKYQERLSLKIVIGSEQDAAEAMLLMLETDIGDVILQPLDGKFNNLMEFVEMVKNEWSNVYHKFDVRFLPQMHKLQGIK